MTATAPAFWTFFALRTNAHEPRSTRAILPATAAAFVIVEQASVVEGPAPSEASWAATTWAVTPGFESGSPKSAVPTVYVPATEAGAVTKRRVFAL